MGIRTLRRDDPLIRVALPASLAIHLAIAALIPALVVIQSTGPAVETISFVRVLRVTENVTRPVARKRAATAPRPRVLPRAAHPRPAPAPVARRPLPAPPVPHPALNAAPLVAAAHTGAAHAVTDVSAPPATSAPERSQVASASTARMPGGYLPLGAEEPEPVLDPQVQRRLARLGVHVRLLVTVDDRGRTKSIVFTPALDGALEARIRAILADASWDPAVCGGGVPCQGVTTIDL